jgi:hypothetical protein
MSLALPQALFHSLKTKLHKTVSVVTDCVPSMTDKEEGFVMFDTITSVKAKIFISLQCSSRSAAW